MSLLIWPLSEKMTAPAAAVEPPQQAEMTEAVTDSPAPAADIFNQVQTLLQSAQISANQNDSVAALAQLDQATVLSKTLPSGESRDRLLSPIGLQLIELKAFDQVQTVAQSMTYETLGNADLVRVELEKALVKAYIQSQQTPQSVQLIQALQPEMRDPYWVLAIETLAQQGDVSEATALFKNVANQDYLRYMAVKAITQAHIGAEQFDQAQAFLVQQPSTDPLDTASGLNEVALWAARANRIEEATAIAQQIPATNRARVLVSIAEICQARGQTECAVNLLAAAAALPYPADSWWSGFEATTTIAMAYVSLGYPEAAENVLNAAEQNAPITPESPYPADEWIGAFAKIGAFDRASQLLARLPEAGRNEGQFRIATAYTDQAQYEQAITFVSKIPDGVLFPLPDYPDPKVELLERILKETIQQEQFAIAKRAALVMQQPVDQVQALQVIATAYQERQQLQLATETLDQALAIANTIDRHELYVDRHIYHAVPNADLLRAIAEGYWAAGQQEKAVATLESALQSEKAFKSSDLQVPWSILGEIRSIAQLAHDWQQPDLRQLAVTEGEARIAKVLEQPDISRDLLIEQLTGLVSLSYEPGTTPNETVTRHLARLETLREQAASPEASPEGTSPEAASPEQQLSILYNLIYLYNLTEQPQQVRASVEQSLPLIAPLSSDLRDGHYTRLAITIAPDSAGVSQLIPLLSSPQKQVDALLEIGKQFATKDQSTEALNYFDQALALAQTSLSASNFESTMVNLANGYGFFNTGGYYSAPKRTPAEVMLMSRLPQYISNPNLRSRVLISFAPNLPPAEAQTAYAELSSTLTEIPNARRTLLWEGLSEALAAQNFEQATQLATALDGEYRQSALGLVEIARQP